MQTNANTNQDERRQHRAGHAGGDAPAMNDGPAAFPMALLASVLHDLRAPLSVMMGAAEVLRHSQPRMDEDERHAFLAIIRHEGERLDGYLRNLQHMTRASRDAAGGLALVRDWVGIDEIVGCAVNRARRLGAGARIDVEAAPRLALLHVHGALLEQAIFNVLHNATKYSPADEAILVRIEQNARETIVEIRDAGPGIAASVGEHAFEMFVTDAGDTHGGSGLGLWISRSIVRAHGGDIRTCPADLPHGTCFRLTLPTREAPPDAAP